MTDAPLARIRYHRPPDREDLFAQSIVHRSDTVVVTYQPRTPLRRPVVIEGEVVLEDAAPAIWFTFPGKWYDIGRFHRADGTFTGIYTNLLTPVRFLAPDAWSTTDLFLDLWQGTDGDPILLDEDEFREAVDQGWIDRATAEIADAEARRILDLARRNAWPPPPVDEWTLERIEALG